MIDEHWKTITFDGKTFAPFHKRVIPVRADRPDRTFLLRGLTLAGLRRLIRDELRAGAIITPSYQQDLHDKHATAGGVS